MGFLKTTDQYDPVDRPAEQDDAYKSFDDAQTHKTRSMEHESAEPRFSTEEKLLWEELPPVNKVAPLAINPPAAAIDGES